MSRIFKLIFASVLFAGVALMNTIPAQAKQDPATEEPKLVAGTLLPAADKKHLLEDNFVLTKKVATMPPLVQEEMLGIHTREGMADAGQPYQATDVVGPKPLPFRRLIFAGTSPGYCVVYYEYGGFGIGQDISLYRSLPGQASLVWYAHLQDGRKRLSLPELRSAINKGKFYSLRLPVAFRVY